MSQTLETDAKLGPSTSVKDKQIGLKEMTSTLPQHTLARTMSTVAPTTRRPPFTETANHPNPVMATSPAKPMKDQKAPSSPPLPRQNSKILPPSPPKVIRDSSRSLEYSRVGFLGEGGFARVYEVQDGQGVRWAVKVVTKSSLKTKKAKTKLYAEIKIHRSLEHPNIVHFGECFEDNDNVYMTLELCHSGSLMDILRRRRRFTEPETRYFTVQLLGACHYMHSHQVIHRDLKLGNLFLDANMNIKVGDFGLAALIENPGERKKTICGTPNYIAPEVLFDTANGHSFEVDTWSIGVILYTLIIGRPPFQTKDVKTIYKRIRDNQYEFPADRDVSRDARELIQQILTPDPQKRPTLHEILDHAFFTLNAVPLKIPTSAQDTAPDFRFLTQHMSATNLANLRKLALLDDDQVTGISVPSSTALSASVKGKASIGSSTSLAQQEREFQKAVQPSSPISALLGAARQPLLVSTNGPREREQPLIRKLQAAAKERDREGKSPSRHGPGPSGGKTALGPSGLGNIEEENTIDEANNRRKELESHKARIVAQMIPGPPSSATTVALHVLSEETENMPPQPKELYAKEIGRRPITRSTAGAVKVNGFDAVAQTLKEAFEAMARGEVFRDPREDIDLPDAKVFIVSWVDYCNKYGMGYALTDGSVGVHFNDSTSVVMSPDKHHLDYITSRKAGAVYVRKNHTANEYPDELKSKIYLLKHFERYIMDRLYGQYPYTFEDLERSKGMEFVQKYLRMKHVIVFKLSHDVLQFNFYDHTKVIFSSQGLLVTHINKEYELSKWSLSEIIWQSLHGPADDPVEAKFNQRLMDKIKYCKEVLLSIKNLNTTNGQTLDSAADGLGLEFQ